MSNVLVQGSGARATPAWPGRCLWRSGADGGGAAAWLSLRRLGSIPSCIVCLVETRSCVIVLFAPFFSLSQELVKCCHKSYALCIDISVLLVFAVQGYVDYFFANYNLWSSYTLVKEKLLDLAGVDLARKQMERWLIQRPIDGL